MNWFFSRMPTPLVDAQLFVITFHWEQRGVNVSVMPWDIYRPFYEYLPFFEKLYKSPANDARVDGVETSDTFGVGLPPAVMFVIQKARSWRPSTPVEMHGHNDYGLGTSIMLSAVMGGAEYEPYDR